MHQAELTATTAQTKFAETIGEGEPTLANQLMMVIKLYKELEMSLLTKILLGMSLLAVFSVPLVHIVKVEPTLGYASAKDPNEHLDDGGTYCWNLSVQSCGENRGGTDKRQPVYDGF